MLALCLCILPLLAADFAADQRRAALELAAARQALPELFAAGDLALAEQRLVSSVPADKPSAAHWLQIGDIFAGLDPAFSMRMHGRAYELAPDERAIQVEWAIELQRAGFLAQAAAVYAAIPAREGDARVALLEAECLVRLERDEEAVQAWNRVRQSPAATKLLRFLAQRISSEVTHERRRLDLRAAIRAGTLEGAEELVFLEIARTGPGQMELERAELERDRALLAAHLDPAARRMREMWAVADYRAALVLQGIVVPAGSQPAHALGAAVDELGWLEPGGEPPRNAFVLEEALPALLETGLVGSEELLALWERTLASRLEGGEAAAGRALCVLQAATGRRELGETQAALWRLARDEQAAVELLRARASKLEPEDELLVAALAAHPRSQGLCGLAREAAERTGKGLRAALRREIAAAFAPPGNAQAAEHAFTQLAELCAADERRRDERR